MLRKSSNNQSEVKVISFLDCPAKTYVRPDGKIQPGRTVLNHCQIVGEVAREIIRRFPTAIAQELFPVGAPLAAGGHDIGKASPTFAEKIHQACDPDLVNTDRLPNINPRLEAKWGGHAGVSQLTAKALNAPDFIPEILGQHHGFAPQVAGMRAEDENFGGPGWQHEREQLVVALKRCLNEDWPTVDSLPQARLLSGLTSVADWIGSGEFFEDPQAPWEENIGRALDAAGFVPSTYRTGLNFEQLFGFTPREAQSILIEQVASPGVYVLEAPMGLGKTEAALYVAYKMLSTGQASGIYFALPTQLTSNKIFERFNQFLQGDKEKGLSGILAADCRHRSLLLHGNAWLLDTDMGEEGRPGGAWFNQAKRGLLAPFAVGTIDQALMAAMNVKHGFVRAFGLAGKVVILDEVHTYDAYTGTLLDALVALLRSLRCTVIILSATLNRERRQQLLGVTLSARDYPLITACPAQANVHEIPVPAGPSREFAIQLHCDEKLAVEQALLRAEQGQQVLWIENTVLEAQQRYLDLAARASELGVACGLLHSRFTADDRQCIEDRWVDLFGKPGWSKRGEQGRILVGTQVLEQSLDIDADFMVTRFAPSDMLLQRIGRLWRHHETPRCQTAKPEAWLLAPELEAAIDSPEKYFGSSAFVYSPYVLCRSLEVWQPIQAVCVPHDIRELIERTYVTRQDQGQMSRWLSELDNGTRWRTGRNALRQLARVTLAEAGNTLPESKAQTRYSEADNFEVLLLRSMRLVPEEQSTLLTLLSGEQLSLPWKRYQLSKPQWRQLSATLMRQVVALRIQDAPKALPLDKLKRFGLQHCFYLGNPDWPTDESLLRVALVDETGSLKGVEYADIHDKHNLEYRNDLGYRVIKN
ncbi:CRISPR-associated helicase Cas3' [Shewanella salipaludis]|uniref:CRISPR-associated helicase Cas3 n=1 Tax=Shewanella salipaludis TaxID=2723052 RepID=A0A972FZU6_9GAMM|nr:CRISPR-associated helicase Cas3' [Shewanella salipaludis]NMH65732.1 CRISPR-associated helicase Cas3' [Shewanella salipaludis]